MASVLVAGWLMPVDADNFPHFPGEVLLMTRIMTLVTVNLWPMQEVCSLTAELGWLLSMCSLHPVPNALAVSPIHSLSQPPHFTLYSSTHCFHFITLVFEFYQQGPRGVKGFVVRRYMPW